MLTKNKSRTLRSIFDLHRLFISLIVLMKQHLLEHKYVLVNKDDHKPNSIIRNQQQI